MKTFQISLIAGILATALFAKADNSVYQTYTKIQCDYPAGGGTAQKLSIQTPDGQDIRNVGDSYEVIKLPFKVNGSDELTEWKVSKRVTRAEYELVYSYMNPFFISDIEITYLESSIDKTTTIKGTWTVDYPLVIEFDCELLP